MLKNTRTVLHWRSHSETPLHPSDRTINSVVGFLQGYLDNEIQGRLHGQEDILNSTITLLDSLLYQDQEQLLRMLTQDTIYQAADPQYFMEVSVRKRWRGALQKTELHQLRPPWTNEIVGIT